ncbi:nucleotidyltransferase domain-containing protein [Myxococcota bacterium]|nr:nucleotidyltransferase domain-containing protein [Myxococcota bacterium]
MALPDVDVPNLDALVRYLDAQPDVAAAWVFGSRARGDHRSGSDVDLALLGGRGWEARPDSLERALDWSREIPEVLGLPPDGVDVVVAQDLKPLAALAVVREGILVFDRDWRLRTEWQLRALHRGLDSERLRRLSWEARARRLGGGPP